MAQAAEHTDRWQWDRKIEHPSVGSFKTLFCHLCVQSHAKKWDKTCRQSPHTGAGHRRVSYDVVTVSVTCDVWRVAQCHGHQHHLALVTATSATGTTLWPVEPECNYQSWKRSFIKFEDLQSQRWRNKWWGTGGFNQPAHPSWHFAYQFYIYLPWG